MSSSGVDDTLREDSSGLAHRLALLSYADGYRCFRRNYLLRSGGKHQGRMVRVRGVASQPS